MRWHGTASIILGEAAIERQGDHLPDGGTITSAGNRCVAQGDTPSRMFAFHRAFKAGHAVGFESGFRAPRLRGPAPAASQLARPGPSSSEAIARRSSSESRGEEVAVRRTPAPVPGAGRHLRVLCISPALGNQSPPKQGARPDRPINTIHRSRAAQSGSRRTASPRPAQPGPPGPGRAPSWVESKARRRRFCAASTARTGRPSAARHLNPALGAAESWRTAAAAKKARQGGSNAAEGCNKTHQKACGTGETRHSTVTLIGQVAR